MQVSITAGYVTVQKIIILASVTYLIVGGMVVVSRTP